ncbi:hypothetical protein JCM10512_882 [Bacteroides reticulotermitis JCM 10512]|uniref:Uncharacterized protein n=1 Tax=Bacteroides reticulotermitis JCM 10512 TaxID=1445607 RepID=W4UNB4_9BACE|nr:hypothetical protein JCM10512_882 [Bacteroides reticulotermitis JCM 10512]
MFGGASAELGCTHVGSFSPFSPNWGLVYRKFAFALDAVCCVMLSFVCFETVSIG